MEVAYKNNAQKIVQIKLKFGKFALVEEDQFRYCIDLLREEHEMIRDMEVVITWEAGIIRCQQCKYWGPSEVPEGTVGMVHSFKCPDCDSYKTTIVQGLETNIENISVSN